MKSKINFHGKWKLNCQYLTKFITPYRQYYGFPSFNQRNLVGNCIHFYSANYEFCKCALLLIVGTTKSTKRNRCASRESYLWINSRGFNTIDVFHDCIRKLSSFTKNCSSRVSLIRNYIFPHIKFYYKIRPTIFCNWQKVIIIN